MSEKKKNLLVLVGAILVALLLVWGGIRIGSIIAQRRTASPYAAVYLSTGDLYFGKLSWFPRMKLSDVWLLQRSVGKDGQSSVQVVPFRNSVWAPQGVLYLNPKRVVFWTKLRKDSAVAQAIENARRGVAPASVPPTTPPPGPSAAPSPNGGEKAK
ncbi:hypothetical protein D6779_11630 [Candidatus Parcubacteria bacterium]|nr:MAG: hypothetical protein D6779_11630 [Candidatus Parcubacteria bacterium]